MESRPLSETAQPCRRILAFRIENRKTFGLRSFGKFSIAHHEYDNWELRNKF